MDTSGTIKCQDCQEHNDSERLVPWCWCLVVVGTGNDDDYQFSLRHLRQMDHGSMRPCAPVSSRYGKIGKSKFIRLRDKHTTSSRYYNPKLLCMYCNNTQQWPCLHPAKSNPDSLRNEFLGRKRVSFGSLQFTFLTGVEQTRIGNIGL